MKISFQQTYLPHYFFNYLIFTLFNLHRKEHNTKRQIFFHVTFTSRKMQMYFKIGAFNNFAMLRKTPDLKTIFNEAATLKTSNFNKEILYHRFFLWISRIAFWDRIPPVDASAYSFQSWNLMVVEKVKTNLVISF